jgi:hypothetical protein
MRTLSLLFSVTLCLAAVGCGGSDEDSGPGAGKKEPIPGGGVGGAALDGRADVFVLASDNSPIANVTIYVGEGTAAASVGVTDSSGHLSASDDALVSGSVLTASASGLGSVSYAGVTGSLVTFVISKGAATDVTVSGTIAGWDDLPDPAPGKYRVARAVASRPLDLGTLDGVKATAGSDACFRKSGQPAECAFQVQAHPASELLLAVIAEGDDAGTPEDFSDDSVVATALAAGNGPGNGGNTTGAALDILSESDIAHASVTLGNASGLVQVIGVPGVGVNGQVAAFPTFDSELASYPIPRAVGALADSKLWAIGAGASANDAIHSIVVTRGLEAPSGTEPLATTVGDFLAPPSVTGNADTFEITRAASGIHALSFLGTSPLEVWLLDERTSYTPPSDIDVSGATVEVSTNDASGDLHPGTIANDLSRRSRQRL